MKDHVRQGDVLVIDCDAVELGAEVPKEKGAVILAHGEATGHAHALRDRSARMYFAPTAKGATKENPARILNLVKTVALSHEEHTKIPLDKGQKRVIRQVEYTSEELRRVADYD